jgi:hypothetical protein
MIVSAIWIGFVVVARMDSKRKQAEHNKKKDKPQFRSEKDLNEYAKPMEDKHQEQVNFDDAEWD